MALVVEKTARHVRALFLGWCSLKTLLGAVHDSLQCSLLVSFDPYLRDSNSLRTLSRTTAPYTTLRRHLLLGDIYCSQNRVGLGILRVRGNEIMTMKF